MAHHLTIIRGTGKVISYYSTKGSNLYAYLDTLFKFKISYFISIHVMLLFLARVGNDLVSMNITKPRT